MQNSPPRSRQALLRQQKQAAFVGRHEIITQFRENVRRSPEKWCFLYNLYGQGGVGKSTLSRQFRQIAEEAGFGTALTNDDQTSVPESLGELAAQLEQQGHRLSQFTERYRVYRQRKQELETDPDAPQGFSAFVGRTVAKAGLGLMKQVPGSGAVTPFLDEDSLVSQAGEWSAFVARKLSNKDEVELVQEPVNVLTPLFLQDLQKLAANRNLLLLFDTYERTSEFLDRWLREVLEGKYGELPWNVMLVVAGRDALDRNRWADYENAIARISLEPFTEAEATQYLQNQGVTNPQVIEVILRLSGRLPLLVSMLAAQSPNDPSQIGDPSGTAVERFLQWVDDPKRRQVALDAALPRLLNQDILSVLVEEADAAALFGWLKTMSFVEERSSGWVYHDIVRGQMLQHNRLTSPQHWAKRHRNLADYFEQQKAPHQTDDERHWTDPLWQQPALNALYHRLCESVPAYLPTAINQFLVALKNNYSFAEEWAAIIAAAEQATAFPGSSCWGDRLVNGLCAYGENRYDETLGLFNQLLDYPSLELQWRPVAYSWREETYRLMERYEEALKDFTQAIELNPKWAWAIASRGQTYQAMERYEEALVDFTQAIELNPKYVWAIASRGQTYRAMERYEEALTDFNQAVELDPKADWAIACRGQTYREMERYQEALADFTQAIELDPKYEWAISRRAEIYGLLKSYGQACEDYSRAIELDPENDWHPCCRGLMYLAINQAALAKPDLERAIQLAQQRYDRDATDFRNTFNLAIYCLADGDLEQSKHFYQDAFSAKQPPSDRIREAIGDLEIFLAIFPDHAWAKKVKAALEKRL
ncbi:MAG: tetratricopeptide repeat protein [Cyanobacteria bacterium J069]|nr:MAG: tetratricopeptide repeat protein [Cyanobacteria bacterium J069]